VSNETQRSSPHERKRYRLATMASGAGHVDDLIPAYALGALEPEDVARVDEHVLSCDSCAAELSESRRTTSLLPFAVSLQTPSPDVKVALFARIAHVQQNADQHVTSSRPHAPDEALTPALPVSAGATMAAAPRQRKGVWGRSLPLVTTVPLVLALGLLGAWTLILQDNNQTQADENRTLRNTLSDMRGAFLSGDQNLDFTAGSDGSDAVGRISYSKDDGEATFVVSGLANRGSGIDYDVYAITSDSGEYVHAGELGVDSRGNGMTTMLLEPPFDQYANVCVAEHGQDPEIDCSVLRSASSVPPASGN
jgi:hypothetical protein